ncbi:unnamed protein product [Arctia plantaginis]|uniref:Uncharacterized protein n=1 Tax=Arctia plantaginis TaxID=874455 RepID=A0A8S1B174_ARCPL|nr:unnamed protein product [Arctia plantaginis]
MTLKHKLGYHLSPTNIKPIDFISTFSKKSPLLTSTKSWFLSPYREEAWLLDDYNRSSNSIVCEIYCVNVKCAVLDPKLKNTVKRLKEGVIYKP